MNSHQLYPVQRLKGSRDLTAQGAEARLPGLLLVNFNQLYKISRLAFGLWCSVLARSPRANIWLLVRPAQPVLICSSLYVAVPACCQCSDSGAASTAMPLLALRSRLCTCLRCSINLQMASRTYVRNSPVAASRNAASVFRAYGRSALTSGADLSSRFTA